MEGHGLPFGAAVIRAGQASDGTLVLLSGRVSADPAGFRVAESLIETSGDVCAVVPKVLWSDGSLAEAGAVGLTDGTLVSCGDGDSPQRSEHRFRRPVDGTRFGCAAIRRSVIADLALDPALDDPAEVVAGVLSELRRLGRLIVFEPAWSVTLSPEATSAAAPEAPPGKVAPARRAAVRDARMLQRVLVVTGSLAGGPSPWADDGVMDLLGALRAACPSSRLVVACADGFGGEEAARGLRAAGIEVEAGPSDWSRWFEDRVYHFSHLVVTDAALMSGLARYALETQPQAAKILLTATLPFRAVEGMLPVTPYVERVGHELVRATVAAHTSETVRQFDSVWCGSVDDEQYLSGLLSGVPVKLLTRPVGEKSSPDGGHAERWGLAVTAEPGADIVAGHEDAAVAAAEEIFSRLYRRDPRLRLAVVTDRPSPMVAQLAALPGVQLVAPGDDGGLGCLAGARVVLAPYRHGLGGPSVLWAALTTRTPVLTTPFGARGFLLGGLAARAVVDDPLDLIERAWILHHDADVWNLYRTAMDEVSQQHHSAAGYAAGVGEALLELGVAPESRPGRRARLGPIATGGRRHRSAVPPGVRSPALRPGETPSRATTGVPDGVSEVEGYRLWRESRANAAVLEGLRTEVASLDYHPKISIITPVYNTDPDVLEAMVASIRDQIYGNWELCLADDASTRDDTRRVLHGLRDDPRISIMSLPGQSGIAGASNAAISMASGDYITLLDHDDLLKPHALAQVVRWLNHDPTLDLLYSDEDKLNQAGELVTPFFKPDWSPNLLMSTNYVCHLLVVRKSLIDKLGGFRFGFDGSQDHDLVLRLTEETDRIAHIPEPLYTWRMVPGSAAAIADAKPYAFKAAKRALLDALERRGRPGTVGDGVITGVYRARYAIPGEPRVSIIIPTRDKVELLRRCVESVMQKSTYRNYEIVVIDNDSRDPATLEYLAGFQGRVVRYPEAFNYARMMNLAAHSVSCDAMLLLNNDTEVITADWIESLLEHAMRPEVGAVGCRLYLPDGQPQHEGIFVGVMGTATNVNHRGFWGLGEMTRDFSAVTGACVMIRPSVYWAVGGNDERLRVAYNDVDICLRIRQAGYQVLYTPYAELVHVEGASRAGYEHDDDKAWFTVRWRQSENWDPFYNPNFDRGRLFRIAL